MNDIICKNIPNMHNMTNKFKENFLNIYENLLNSNKNIYINYNNYNLESLTLLVRKVQPYKITHINIKDEDFHKTIFQGHELAILVDGFMTSDSRDFGMILTSLGIREILIEEYIYSKKADNNLVELIVIDNV